MTKKVFEFKLKMEFYLTIMLTYDRTLTYVNHLLIVNIDNIGGKCI
jgi:hypothetical protein